MKKIIVFLAAFLAAVTLSLVGGSPAKDPAPQLSAIPADAQWASYVNVPRLTASTMFKALLDKGEMAKIQGKTDPFFAKLKIDPLKDLRGVTVFGTGKGEEDAVVALSGKFDRAHLVNLVKSETSHKEIPHGKYTIYKWDEDEVGRTNLVSALQRAESPYQREINELKKTLKSTADYLSSRFVTGLGENNH